MAPALPGVYAFGRRYAVQGLPSTFEWAYVGRSDRLRARLVQHRPHSERNLDLRRWLLQHLGSLEVWFASTSAQESRLFEANLVSKLGPIHNKIKFVKEKEDE